MAKKPASETGRRDGTGIQGLDEILGGGLPSERLYLIEGAPGTGKTTLAMQFLMEGAKRGEVGLYVTLSESAQELAEVAISHGWDTKGVNVFEMVANEDAALPEGQYTFFHPSEVELGKTTKTLVDEVDRVKPKRVVFDSLSELRLLAQSPLKYRRQVLAMKQFFADRKCTVLVLDDLTSTEDDLQPQSIAHGVICLQNVAPEYGNDRRRLRVLKLRGVRFHGGFHDYNIAHGGLRVFPRLVASGHVADFEQDVIASQSPELNLLMGGGIPRGTSTLILGPAGSGKSSVAASFVATMCSRGEKCTVFLFDENIRTYLARASSLGLKLDEYVRSGVLKLRQVDPAEMPPGEFAHLAREAVETDGVRGVVVDSLSGFLHAMPSENHLLLHMHEMLTYLNQMGVVTILLLAQHGLIGAGMDSRNADVSYIADTTVLLRYFEAHGRVHKAMSVLKKRIGRHEDTIRQFRLSDKGVEVGQPLDQFQGVLSGVPTFLGLESSLMMPSHDQPRP